MQNVEAKESTIRRLHRHGFLVGFPDLAAALQGMSEATLADLVRRYQEFHGIDSDGHVGPQTMRSFCEQRICAHPDVMPMQAELSAWPMKRVLWHVVNPSAFGGLTEQGVLDAFTWATLQWNAVCGIQFEYTPSPERANVVIECAAIDRPGGTLAWSELADGSSRRKSQRFDSMEAWVFGQGNQLPRLKIDLGRTACHEIGHVLGLPHIASGNLLQPMYDLNIWSPQAGDIAEARARYGPPATTTPPPSGPVDPKKWEIVISGTGEIDAITATGFRINRMA